MGVEAVSNPPTKENFARGSANLGAFEQFLNSPEPGNVVLPGGVTVDNFLKILFDNQTAFAAAIAALLPTALAETQEARDQAVAAAEASGVAAIFNTKALANAALAGLPDLSLVEVLVDESVSGSPRTRYRKEGGVYVLKINLDLLRTDLADSANGKGADQVANAVIRRGTVALLTAMPKPPRPTIAHTEGYRTAGDGGHASYRWVAGSTATITGGSVLGTDAGGDGRWFMIIDGDASDIRKWGAWLDNVHEDYLPIRNALTYLGHAHVPAIGPGITWAYIGANNLEMGDRQSVTGDASGRSAIRNTASGALLFGDATLNNYCKISGLYLQTDGDNAIGLDWSNFAWLKIHDIVVGIRGANSSGFFAQGNGLGTGPYYCDVSEIGATGRVNPSLYPNQRGFVLAANDASIYLANGPNANNIYSIKRISGVSVGLDITGGNGDMIGFVQLEAISDIGIAFNKRPADFSGAFTAANANTMTADGTPFPTAGISALKITGGTGSGQSAPVASQTSSVLTIMGQWETTPVAPGTYEAYICRTLGVRIGYVRMEGASTAKLAKFYAGASSNSIEKTHITSISAVHWEREIADDSNRVMSGAGEAHDLIFTLNGIPANTTTKLAPIGVGAFGGYAVAASSYIDAARIALTGLTGVTGTATLKFYKGGLEVTDMRAVLSAACPSRLVKVASKLDTSSTNFFNGQNMSADITTSADWTGTTCSISVLTTTRRLQ